MSHICHVIYLQADLQKHWHCDRCIDVTYTANDARARAKHVDLFHTPMACVCGVQLELAQVPHHIQSVRPSSISVTYVIWSL